jgi:hypothetical protein
LATWLESQINIHTQQITTLQDQLAQLTARVITLEQAQQNTGFGYQGGGSGAAIYFYAGGSVIPAATGLPGSGTPGGPVTGATVYQILNGAFSTFSTSASIYNGLMSPTVSGKGCILEQNADGTFTVIAQSCT